MLWGIKGAERDVWGEFRGCEWADTEHREGFIRRKQERKWKWRVSEESLFTKRWCKSLPDNGSWSLWENFRVAEETWACQFLETRGKGEGGQEDLLSLWEKAHYWWNYTSHRDVISWFLAADKCWSPWRISVLTECLGSERSSGDYLVQPPAKAG